MEAKERVKRLELEDSNPVSVDGQITEPYMFVTDPIMEQLGNSLNPPQDRTRVAPYNAASCRASQAERDKALRTARAICNDGR